MNKNKEFYVGRALGNSMDPLVHANDSIFIIPVSNDKFSIGDIVVYFRKRQLISHRIVRIWRNKYITKGDNAYWFDQPVDQSNILGKVVRIERSGKSIKFDTIFKRTINFYYIIYSLVSFYIPLICSKLIGKIFFGRTFLTWFLISKK